jgi:hypothetical protein
MCFLMSSLSRRPLITKPLQPGGTFVDAYRTSPPSSIGQKTTFYDYGERQKMSPFGLRKLPRFSSQWLPSGTASPAAAFDSRPSANYHKKTVTINWLSKLPGISRRCHPESQLALSEICDGRFMRREAPAFRLSPAFRPGCQQSHLNSNKKREEAELPPFCPNLA